MHRVLVSNFSGALVEISADQARHLARVVRLGPGDALVAFDGRGREWDARVESVGRQGATIALMAERQPVPEPLVAVTLAVGVLTGDQMADVVRDATALGVTAVAPFLSEHTSVSERRDWTSARDRWARVAVSAAMQCGRAVVPEISPVVDLATLVASESPERTRIACVEPAHARAADSALTSSAPRAAILFVGPEGGWTAREIATFAAAGALFIHLGPRTLRAELAPTVALSMLWTTWGWR